jgi:hypothetical protein
MVKAKQAIGSRSASPAPPPPRMTRQALMNNAVVPKQHTLTESSLAGLRKLESSSCVSEGPVGEWLNSSLSDQAGRQQNGLDELQHGLANLLGFFGLSSASEDGSMVRPQISSVIGPDSPPANSSQSPRLLFPVQQRTRHSPAINSATLHQFASTAVRLPKSAQRIPSVQRPPFDPSGQDQHGLKADQAADVARTNNSNKVHDWSGNRRRSI